MVSTVPGSRVLLEVDKMVVSWWIVAFLHCVQSKQNEASQIQPQTKVLQKIVSFIFIIL